MAEAAGLVVGAIALVSIFRDCVDLFSDISAAKSLGRDYEILNTKLDIEKTRFLHWAERLKLADPDHYDERLDDLETHQIIARTLAGIRLLLGESGELQNRYGLEPAVPRSAAPAVPVLSANAGTRFSWECQRLDQRIENHRRTSLFKTVRWIARDKEKFDCLISELSYFVSSLNSIVPDLFQAAKSTLQNDLRGLNDIRGLKLIARAGVGRTADADLELTASTGEAIDRACKQRILECVWFRMLDDRIDSVAKAHRKTLEWALHPPSKHVPWDDLSQWFECGSGIYWICGKAGSGKSTLMKYLVHEPQTQTLLRKWSSSRGGDLATAQFFLWSAGTPEQKTQKGLMQGLLYQVLEANPSLIPTLLPKMWRELYNSEFDEKFNLEPPTVNEIRDAFSRLAKHESGELYCFFIDGLDEYHGDYTDGTSFIEGLVVGGNIKVLVSSRPIDACVHAFSSRPKLQVQDLTKGDIQLYITDTIGSHPYMEALVADDREAADRVLKNLTEKASGVFLWVVLACRSLLEGFMAGDYVQDLLLRVDELPRELEDLFRHMLGKVPLRYRRTASKILRVCYENQVLGIEAQVLTMPLALMSEQDLDIQRLPEFRPFTKAQKILKCSNLEARLRSRCCGLVEVHLANSKAIPPGCFCREQDLLRGSLTTRYRELTRPLAHDSLVDSTVYFLHRTVFDFLSTPDVWELDCLSLEDENFDPSAVLACMAATKLYHGTRPHSYVELIRQSMEYSFANSRLKGPSVDHVCSWLGSALLATAEAVRGAGETSQISAAPYFKRILHIRRPEIITIALAVEGNFTGFVERPEVLARLRDPAVRHTNPPLLCLTTVQPNLSKLQISRDRPSLRMLSLLFSLGCDPNEPFSRHGIATTPWEVAWGSGDLRPEHHKSASLGAIKLLVELTAAFLRAGAIVPPFQSTSGPTSFRLPTHTNIMSAVEYWRTCLVPTSLTLESHALVERCEEIIQMIQAQNKSILEFGSECIIERDMPPEQENTGDEEVGTTSSGPREINFDIDAPSPPGNVSPRGNASAVGHDFWFDSSDEEESTSDSSDDSSSEDDIFVYNDPILDSPFNPRRVRASK